MNAEGIKSIVLEVFSQHNPETINGWVSIKCPISQWTHDRGKDSRASAGIHISDQGVSVFNCFTCGNKAPLQGLLRRYANYTGEDLDSLIEEVEEQSYLGPRVLPSWDELGRGTEPLTELKQAVYLDLYDPAAGHPYLYERGISDETADRLSLMIDPCDPADSEERILFPVFGTQGELYGLSGRATNPEAKLKVRDYFGLPKAACLLGAHLIREEKPNKILLGEGLFDYARAWECDQPFLAVMHSSLTIRQAEILRDFALPVYLFYDNDKAGRKGCNEAGKLLFDYVPVMEVRWPAEASDPGLLLPEEFDKMVKTAKLWYPEY